MRNIFKDYENTADKENDSVKRNIFNHKLNQ